MRPELPEAPVQQGPRDRRGRKATKEFKESRARKVIREFLEHLVLMEHLIARHAGMRVLALSLITNLAAGLSDEPLSHALTLSAAQAASDQSDAAAHTSLAAASSERS